MQITLIAVPYDSGHLLARMGAGPRHLLDGGLARRLREAGHQVETEVVLLDDGFHTEATAGVELMRQVSGRVTAAREAGRFPVLLSGNCGTLVGSVSALGPATTGLLWFDAHGDLNTPDTSPSGYFDGMGFALLLGHGWQGLAATIAGFTPLPAENAALLAPRDLDPGEIALIEETGLLSLPPAELRTTAGREALAALGKRVERLHVHVDLDALDPEVIVGNHLPVPGGLEPEEVVEATGAATAHAPLASVSFASFHPEEDERDPGVAVVAEILVGLLDGRNATTKPT